MTDIKTMPKDVLATAENVIPVGLHETDQGTLAFDPVDEAMIRDLKTFIDLYAAAWPDVSKGVQASKALSLVTQRDRFSKVMEALMRQVLDGDLDKTAPFKMELMLANSFARFPYFVDLKSMAEGSGDRDFDPAPEDAKVRDNMMGVQF